MWNLHAAVCRMSKAEVQRVVEGWRAVIQFAFLVCTESCWRIRRLMLNSHWHFALLDTKELNHRNSLFFLFYSYSRFSDLMRAGRSENRIPVRVRLFAPNQFVTWATQPPVHKPRERHSVDHQSPFSSKEVKERVTLYLYSHSETS